MRTYCTYFDSRYLARGLALYESLDAQERAFTLWVLALDDPTSAILEKLALPHLRTIALRELEETNRELLETKSSRTLVEYYFTLTPFLPLEVMRRDSEVDMVTYVDADIYFFASPNPIYAEVGSAAVGITEHRFSAGQEDRIRFGRFNVGWLMFRNDAEGRRCLHDWRARCLEWCFDRLEGERYADQKYLDRWPEHFDRVAIIHHPGANVAPWNVAGRTVTCISGTPEIDGQRLVFFHFHQLRRWTSFLWQLGLQSYGVPRNRALVECVYRPYVRALKRWEARLQAMGLRPIRSARAKSIRASIGGPIRVLLGDSLLDFSSSAD